MLEKRDIDTRLEWVAEISVELKINNQKRLYIEEIPTIKAFRDMYLNKWWTDRGSNPGPIA